MTSLNDGSITREQAGQHSAPDVTFAGKDIANGSTWRVLADVGSDHYPIAIDIQFYDPEQIPRSKPKWALGKADWAKFTQLTEQAFKTSPQPGLEKFFH